MFARDGKHAGEVTSPHCRALPGFPSRLVRGSECRQELFPIQQRLMYDSLTCSVLEAADTDCSSAIDESELVRNMLLHLESETGQHYSTRFTSSKASTMKRPPGATCYMYVCCLSIDICVSVVSFEHQQQSWAYWGRHSVCGYLAVSH